MARIKKTTGRWDRLFWYCLLIALIILYHPIFQQYFFGDDFINFYLAKADTAKQVLNFFNLFKPSPQFPFYRPLSTQFFYWLGQQLFGLKPYFYYSTAFLFFLLILVLIYKLVKKLYRRSTALFSVFFYALSISHFYRLFYLSQFQELSLTVFFLLAVLAYIAYKNTGKNQFKAAIFIFFILAIASKETAVTLGPCLFLLDMFFLKKTSQSWRQWLAKNISIFFPLFILTAGYLYLRLHYYGYSRGEEYAFVFNVKSTLNTIFWYGLWSLGMPERFVNTKFFSRQFIINPELFRVYAWFGTIAVLINLIFIVMFVLILFIFFRRRKKNIIKTTFFGISWFLLTLSLLLFFPFHKFSYSLTLPLLGIDLILAVISYHLIKSNRLLAIIFLSVYCLANLSSFCNEYWTHWSVKRGRQSGKITAWLKENYPHLPAETNVYFYDFLISCQNCPTPPYPYNYSQELSHILGQDKGLKIIYNNSINTYYQYQGGIDVTKGHTIILPAAKLLSL